MKGLERDTHTLNRSLVLLRQRHHRRLHAPKELLEQLRVLRQRLHLLRVLHRELLQHLLGRRGVLLEVLPERVQVWEVWDPDVPASACAGTCSGWEREASSSGVWLSGGLLLGRELHGSRQNPILTNLHR